MLVPIWFRKGSQELHVRPSSRARDSETSPRHHGHPQIPFSAPRGPAGPAPAWRSPEPQPWLSYTTSCCSCTWTGHRSADQAPEHTAQAAGLTTELSVSVCRQALRGPHGQGWLPQASALLGRRPPPGHPPGLCAPHVCCHFPPLIMTPLIDRWGQGHRKGLVVNSHFFRVYLQIQSQSKFTICIFKGKM